ncbi:MAG: DUF2490 domain-containing protein [Salinivirgaceae bacterium]|nr:DUF2490 domain-containing protein [Salinivirgaceae bacterium]
MRKIIIASLAALLALPTFVSAQDAIDDGSDFGGRFSAEVDKKLAKGLHTFANGEVRFNENFSNFWRYQGTAGVSYKVNNYLKTAVSYTFIERKTTKDTLTEWKIRHRFTFDITGSYRVGDFKLSLRERLQMTNKKVNNKYQDVENGWTLRTRLMAQYKGLTDWTPYAYVDIRNTLNAPKWTYTFDDLKGVYSDYSWEGYKDVYINRVRLGLGAEWELSKQHSFDFYGLYDFCNEKDIDSNKKGTKLHSVFNHHSRNIYLGVGYKFSF